MASPVLRPLFACLLLGPAIASEPISLAALLPEMTDLTRMAEFPSPAYTCKQFSSYDRASKNPAGGHSWFANGDAGQYLRSETREGRTENVMMDAQGPGAIVRIWSADPKGTMRFYLDGAATPTFAAPWKDLLGGKVAGLPTPIAGMRARGWNLYLPLPYAKSCKVTIDEGGSYYHINYRTYPAGTAVTSFDAGQITANGAAIATIAEQLASPGKLNALPAGATTTPFNLTLAPGATATLGSLTGAQALRLLRLDWKPGTDSEEPALRSTTISMEFDGEQTVVAPLGDFFGSAPGINAYDSLPLTVAKDGRMECRWVMPFQKSAVITVTNHGKAPVPLSGALAAAPYAWGEASMLFHAKWRISHDLNTNPRTDWNYLLAAGQGVFAGASFAIDNPNRQWWGEGDEKIYVDGEAFPSTFGTGTEDYYGYAWCAPELFTHAYHAQPRCDGPGNFGRTSVNRFHILDRIPFTTHFRFDMEIWHWKHCLINASVIDYWYARPGAIDGFKQPTDDDLTLRPRPEFKDAKVPGAIEGEEMRVIEKAGNLGKQDWEGDSSGFHLWWHGGTKPGDRLVLGFKAPKAGVYRVIGRFLKANDYGIASFAINEQKAGEPIDFYNDKVELTDELPLGSATLKEGENQLTITITGANDKAAKAYMVGLDYLKLVPQP
ncbi:MAG: DUF2961 domain-containing protein [Caulobacterales bacterium]|nr:DUF2961 domain-containing protein [Caulobacterales bacterium]